MRMGNESSFISSRDLMGSHRRLLATGTLALYAPAIPCGLLFLLLVSLDMHSIVTFPSSGLELKAATRVDVSERVLRAVAS